MKKPIISLIAAIDKKRGIGKNNKLPWHIPEDLQYFKSVTAGHPVIMGRKTFESIGRPLPKRLNIVVTRDQTYQAQGCTVTHSLEAAVRIASQHDESEIFIIGGGQLFTQTLSLAHRLYLTIVEGDFDTDAFFPDYWQFKKIVSEKRSSDAHYNYTFIQLER